MISIVFPHLLNKQNNALLDLNLKMIEENTTCPYQILMVTDNGDKDMVYKGLDWMFRNAKYDLTLWHSTDVVLAPGWNENVLKHIDDADWLGLELAECGQIGVHPNNICIDFGRTADTFKRKDFEGWARTMALGRPTMREGFGWYSPSVWKKEWYVRMGGIDCSKPFPHPNDSEFRQKCEEQHQKFAVVNSFAYHFQRGHIHGGLQPEHE